MVTDTILGFVAVILMFLVPLIIIGIMIALTIFWVFMLIDAVKRDYKKENDKIVWVLVIIFASFIGAIVYYFIVKKDKKEKVKR